MKRIHTSNSRQGFTLIAVVLVLSLITVLVVSATVVAQVEQNALYNTSRQELARQNALLGLNQALNQLQTAAGPDRRVTARADIINAGSTPTPGTCGYAGTQPANDSGQAFWTGVWRITANDYTACAGNGLTTTPDPTVGQTPGPGGNFFYYDYTPDGNPNNAAGVVSATTVPSRTQLYNVNNVSWLISWPYSSILTAGPDPTTALSPQLKYPPNVNTATAQTVTIAKSLKTTYLSVTSPSASSANVIVPKVPVMELKNGSTNNIQQGNYAYWISDEGVKAKVNLTDPYLGQTPTINYPSTHAHFQVAQANAPTQAFSLTGYGGSAADVRTFSSLYVPTLAAMGFADPSGSWAASSGIDFADNPSTYSPDFTATSYGILADNFNGGLRRDLTAALENNTLFTNQFGTGTSTTDAIRKVYSLDAIYPSIGIKDIYGSAATNAYTTLDGLRWDSLYYYYNIYHTTMQSPLTAGTGNTCPLGGIGSAQFTNELAGQTPALMARFYVEPGNKTGGTKYLVIDGVYPFKVLWTYNVYLGFKQIVAPITTPATPGQYNLYFADSPMMVMSNPFNVGISLPTGGTFKLTGDPDVTGTTGGNTLSILSTTGTTELSVGLGFGGALTYTTTADTTSYAPGELRCYGLPPQTGVSQNYTVGTTGTLTASSSTLSDLNFLSFPPSSGNTTNILQSSTKVANNIYQYEEYAVNPTLSIASTSDTVSYSGVERDTSTVMLFQYLNFYQWPLSTSQASSSAFGEANLPNIGGLSRISNNDPLGTVGSLTTSSTNPTFTKSLISMVDRAPGVNCSLFQQGGGTIKNASNFGVPGFCSGGALYNPLAVDVNCACRDFSDSVKALGQAVSTGDIQTVPLASSHSTATGWLPDSVGMSSNNVQQIVCDVPRQPLLSIGQFKGMFCRYDVLGAPGTAANSSDNNGAGVNYGLNFSFHPLGGSYQACLPANIAFEEPYLLGSTGVAGNGMLNQCLLDDNFLGNEVLFDSYFLSTIPPSGSASTDAGSWQVPTSNLGATNSTTAQGVVDRFQALPNSRLVYYNRSQSATTGNPPSTGTTSPNINDLRASSGTPASTPNILREPAANLLINGAFNINSTSVPAWVSLLTSTSSTSTNQLPLFIAGSGKGGTANSYSPYNFGSNEVPFLNFSVAYTAQNWTGFGAGTSLPFNGVVDCHTSVVYSLAQQIVNQVKLRGPFLSLGDFLNRRLTATTVSPSPANPLSSSGTLQAAIDAVNPNASVQSIGAATSTTNYNYTTIFLSSATSPIAMSTTSFPPVPNNTAAGIPGTLMQNDLVSEIAPVIAARSDTFVIRAYGETLNPSTGKTEGQAWCEATVQRVPEYLYSNENGVPTGEAGNYAFDDPSPNVTNSMPSGTNGWPGTSSSIKGLAPNNYAFGRRFKIISFRWLNSNEL